MRFCVGVRGAELLHPRPPISPPLAAVISFQTVAMTLAVRLHHRKDKVTSCGWLINQVRFSLPSPSLPPPPASSAPHFPPPPPQSCCHNPFLTPITTTAVTNLPSPPPPPHTHTPPHPLLTSPFREFDESDLVGKLV